LRLDEATQERVLGPFHSAVVYEGELALLEMVRDVERGAPPRGVVRGRTVEDMSILPPPDFDGLPLDRYFAPELVLPYDPSRGCYWGVCTFCHYGLAEVGTARYRERPVEAVLDHLALLAQKHGTKVFYFSQDVFSPRIATNIARGIRARGLGLRWGSDMRPERSLTPERCAELVQGGALSAALGVESAAPRVLSLIDKGIPAPAVKKVIHNLSNAGVAVEAMCFSDFPTETYREAMETVRFVDGLKDDLSLFILGRFDLTHGSLVAQKPGEFGIKEVWQIEGDELGTGLFFAERRRAKSARHQAELEDAIRALSGGWRLRRYPWAGALSTAHTMLSYARHGKDAFRRAAPASEGNPRIVPYTATARYDVGEIIASSAENEAAIWDAMVNVARRVTREDYQRRAAAFASALPARAPSIWTYRAGADPVRAAARPAKARQGQARGRRPSHSANATKP
jgi:hypothetical protein